MHNQKRIFEKFVPAQQRLELADEIGTVPVGIKFENMLSPTRAHVNGKEVILLGTNNYLGLTFNDNILNAIKDSLETHGSATTGSRQANGTYEGHIELEKELKEYYNAASAVIFTTGYQANLGAISALGGPGDHLIIDADSHASIYDACKLSDATTLRFRHNDPENLERRLKRLPETGARLVIVESIYSMFGDVAPLKELVEVAHSNDAMILVDEAHSVGCFGETGKGICEEVDLLDKVDFISATFSKSYSSVGGFCLSRHPEFEYVRMMSRPYMFTASSAPANIAAARAALSEIKSSPSLRESLWARSRQLHSGLEEMGFDLCAAAGPIVAVRRPDELTAVTDWNKLLDNGVYVNLAAPPATPAGVSLLRLSVSAAHTESEISKTLDAFRQLL